MSSNVFLAPCDPGNFDRTVLSAIDLSDYPDHPSVLANRGHVRFWGVRKGTQNENYFEKMTTGDLVLFYQKGKYIGVGRVGVTFEDEDHWVSTTFWRNAPSYLIYTIENFDRIAVPRENLNEIFDYTDGFYPQGLIRVADNRISKNTRVVELALKKFSDRNG